MIKSIILILDMHDNHPKSLLDKNELDIKKLLEYLYESKKWIFFVSLSFTLIASIYSFYIKSPVYHSSITLEVGHYDETKLMSSDQIKRSMATLFQKVYVRGSDRYIKLSYSDNSIKNAEETINDAVKYVISETNEKILSNKAKVQFAIYKMESENQFLTKELERINSIDKTLPSSTGIESTISKYKMRLNNNNFEINNINQNYIETQIIKQMETVQGSTNHFIQMLKGLLLGLFLSIVSILLRLAFLRQD